MTGADVGRRIAAILLVVPAALFVVGVAVEGNTHAEPSNEQSGTAAERPAGESGGAHQEGGETVEGGTGGAEEGHDESAGGETVLGIDAESPATVSLLVLISVALAVGLWFTTRRWIAVAAALAAGLFAVVDIAEFFRQLDESRTGLAILAMTIAAGHTVAAACAGRSAWGRSAL